MSAFSGPQGRGAMRRRRARKRLEAEKRNALTPPERRRRYRLDPAVRLLADVFTGEKAS